MECYDRDSTKTVAELEEVFGKWKSNQKQLDDVLAICFTPGVIDFN